MNEFSPELFLPHVGETFVWRAADTAAEARMKLLEVERHQRQPGIEREPFSLLFVMHDQPPLGWSLHTLIHSGFQRCDLLLSRVTVPGHEREDPEGMFYEAVFS